MNMIKPRVSFARDTNMSYHFPAEAGWGTLQWSHYGYISLPPDSQLPQHKSPYLLRDSRLEDGVTLLCSQGAVPKKCCYTQDLSSSQKKPSGEAGETCGCLKITTTSSPLTPLLALPIMTQEE